MDFPKVFMLFSLLVSLASATSVVDFCVADYNYPVAPAGYPCKNPTSVTVDDFVYTGLGVPFEITDTDFNISALPADHTTFPGLNGLGLSLARLDLGVNGVIALHSHRVSEVIFVVEGTLIAGFIASDNTPYYKTLKRGDVMIFPQTLLHFQVNVGKTNAVAIVSLNSANPGFQFTSSSLGGNDIPTDVIQKITLLDVSQVQKLKQIFGGSN